MQESLKTELETLRATISELYAKNDMDSIVTANKLEARVREIEDELEHAHPVEEYYLNNKASHLHTQYQVLMHEKPSHPTNHMR